MVLVSLTAFRVREVLKWRVEGACWVGLSVCSVVGRLGMEGCEGAGVREFVGVQPGDEILLVARSVEFSTLALGAEPG